MTYVDTEEMRRAAQTADSAADSMRRSAGEIEEAVRRLEQQLADGYGGNALRLIELLESLPAPEPAVASPQVTDEQIDAVSIAMRKAFCLGQTYWQQADSESYRQQAKSDVTQATFDTLVDTTRTLLSAPPAVGYVHLVPDEFSDSYDVRFWKKVPMGTKLYASAADAPRQEAKPVAADLTDDQALEMFAQAIGYPLAGNWDGLRAWGRFFTYLELAYAVRKLLAASPQEQAPADKDEWDASAESYHAEVDADFDKLQRDLALEEAAAVCDANPHVFARHVASLIRALKSEVQS